MQPQFTLVLGSGAPVGETKVTARDRASTALTGITSNPNQGRVTANPSPEQFSAGSALVNDNGIRAVIDGA